MKKEEEPDGTFVVALLASLAILFWLLLAAGVQALIQLFGG